MPSNLADMLSEGGPHRHPSGAATFRHRRVPVRVFGPKLIVARPSDGAPVVLAPPATHVWRQLDDPTTLEAVDEMLAEEFPEVSPTTRSRVRGEILTALGADDLLEPG